jgi:hypothetical protein
MFKTKLLRLAQMAMTLALTSCATVSPVPAALYPPGGILKLSPGQTYTAQGNEIWHSAARYAACEMEVVNALSALKQAQNK